MPSKKWEHYWLKLANFMLEHDLNPKACIWYVFQQRVHGEPPMPNQIMLDKYMDAFKRLDAIAKDEIIAEFRADKQRFEICVALYTGQFSKPRDTWEYVLTLSTESFSPLFRYCLAVSERLDDVAYAYELEAMQQYITAPKAYDEVFGQWIPSEMKEQSNEIRRP